MHHAKLQGSISPLPIYTLQRSREGERDLQPQPRQLSAFVLLLSGRKKKKKKNKKPLFVLFPFFVC